MPVINAKPVINTNGMNKFLEEFKKYLGGKEVILIMDNAPSHKSKDLKVLEGIEIEYLPPYSPELNPVERVFQDIKKYFKNKVFDSLDKLEDKLVKVLNSLSDDYLRNLTLYTYIKEAFDMNQLLFFFGFGIIYDKTGFIIEGNIIRLSISKEIKQHLKEKHSIDVNYLRIETRLDSSHLNILNIQIMPYKAYGKVISHTD